MYVLFLVRSFLPCFSSMLSVCDCDCVRFTYRIENCSRIDVCNTILYTQMFEYYFYCSSFCTSTELIRSRVYALLSCAQLEPFMLWLHLNTHTQHEWLLQPIIIHALYFFYMEIFLVPSSLSLFLFLYRRREYACVVHLPLTIIIKFYYVFFVCPSQLICLSLGLSEIPPKFWLHDRKLDSTKIPQLFNGWNWTWNNLVSTCSKHF